MAIWYKYAGYESQLGDESNDQCIRPIVVANGHLRTRDVVGRIVKNNYYSEPDAVKALTTVFAVIEELLKDGKTVTIDNYGTFSLTTQFAKKKVDNLDEEKMNKSTDRRAESIEIKSVVFKANPIMKNRIGTLNIERIPKDFIKRKHEKRE